MGNRIKLPLLKKYNIGKLFKKKLYILSNVKTINMLIYTKAQTFADCVGHELPYGWEECYDGQVGVYYIDHINKQNQIEDPRLTWRTIQEAMLTDYLQSAQNDLNAKQDILQVKAQRLALAQDEYQHLNTTLSNLFSSRSSLSSSGSGAGRCDPDLLKADVAMARNRVGRLKRELHQIKHEVANTQAGMQTLAQVQEKLSGLTSGYSVEEAQAIVSELKNIEESLRMGEKEKADLIKSLTVLREDLMSAETSQSIEAHIEKIAEKNSTASQTDFCGDVMPPSARLAELTRLKLEYESAKNSLKSLQHELAGLEERLSPEELQGDRDSVILIQEKEQLLREYRSVRTYSRDPLALCELDAKISQLEAELAKALEISNKAVAERLGLQEQRQELLCKLRDTIRVMVSLEGQLRSLSASTLSVSSSSSLGSLSTSSKGSLSSLSFTDIYGGQQYSSSEHVSLNVSELQKRVERLLKSNCEADRQYAEKLRSLEEGSCSSVVLSQSMLSLSPRSSLSSLSPPTSACDAVPGMDPLTAPRFTPGECGGGSSSNGSSSNTGRANVDLTSVHERLAELCLTPAIASSDSSVNPATPQLSKNGYKALDPAAIVGTKTAAKELDEFDFNTNVNSSVSGIISRVTGIEGDNILYEIVGEEDEGGSGGLCGVSEDESGNPRTISAAVSDESVAGDSGVYEACPKAGSVSPDCLESPQVQIKLRYSKQENLLNVGVVRARNLSSLSTEEGCKVFEKPYTTAARLRDYSCFMIVNTVSQRLQPYYLDFGPVCVEASMLSPRSIHLQHNILGVIIQTFTYGCVGYAQISLADHNMDCPQTRWYNILNFAHVRPDSLSKDDFSSKSSTLRSSTSATNVKEESSDESTIISSQTSTLTRNLGPEALRLNLQLTSEDFEHVIDSDDDDEDDDEELEEETRDDDQQCQEAVMEALENAEDTAVEGETTDPLVEMADKETNTECMFLMSAGGSSRSSLVGQQQPVASTTSPASSKLEGGIDTNHAAIPLIKRSQTFTPSAPVGKTNYICRLNRSDSDSCVPLYRRASFQRGTMERRSLRWKGRLGGSLRVSSQSPGSSGMKGGRTSLDLELDLAAQQRRLQNLYEELDGLRNLKLQLEDVKNSPEPPSWMLDQTTMTSVISQATKGGGVKTPEDRRMEKMLRKTSREIHKLRNSKTPRGQPDIVSFKEKMAFFLKSQPSIPPLNMESDGEASVLSSPVEAGPVSGLLQSNGPVVHPAQANAPTTCSSVNTPTTTTTQSSYNLTGTYATPISPFRSPISEADETAPVIEETSQRNSTTGAIPKLLRPTVLFTEDDQGVEV
ncbi:unnamed protein product, partial [Meganyctiphanes norvegica]